LVRRLCDKNTYGCDKIDKNSVEMSKPLVLLDFYRPIFVEKPATKMGQKTTKILFATKIPIPNHLA